MILDLCTKFQLSSMFRSASRTPPPVLKVILGGRWRFLTGDLEDGVILDLMDHHDMLSDSRAVWSDKCPPSIEISHSNWGVTLTNQSGEIVVIISAYIGLNLGTFSG